MVYHSKSLYVKPVEETLKLSDKVFVNILIQKDTRKKQWYIHFYRHFKTTKKNPFVIGG